MQSEEFENRIDQFMEPLRGCGYAALPVHLKYLSGNLESQLRAYYMSSVESEPNDYLRDLLEDGEVVSHNFKLHAYQHVFVGNTAHQVNYTFHCINRHPDILIDQLEVLAGDNSHFIPIGPDGKLPFEAEAYRQFLHSIAKENNDATIRNSPQSAKYFLVQRHFISMHVEGFAKIAIGTFDSIKEAFLVLDKLDKATAKPTTYNSPPAFNLYKSIELKDDPLKLVDNFGDPLDHDRTQSLASKRDGMITFYDPQFEKAFHKCVSKFNQIPASETRTIRLG